MLPYSVYKLALAEGLAPEAAVVSVAIAWGESDLNPQAVGDLKLVDSKWGPSLGLWQVRSLHAQRGTGGTRDADRLLDAATNAEAMAEISNRGTNWKPWTVWRNGDYLKHMAAVRAAVERGGMKFVSRDEAGLRPPKGQGASLNVDVATAHWGGDSPGALDHDECAGIWRSWQRQHMDTDQLAAGGANDIAYNAGVCQHGYVFEGRGPGKRSAANGSNEGNGSSYAIVYIGGTPAPFTGEAKIAFNEAAEWLGASLDFGHRDWVGTGCPGDEIYQWVHDGHPIDWDQEDDMAFGQDEANTLKFVHDVILKLVDGVHPENDAYGGAEEINRVVKQVQTAGTPGDDGLTVDEVLEAIRNKLSS